MLELLTKPLELTLGRRSRRKLSTIYRIIHFYTGSWHNDISRENCNGVQDSFNVLTELSAFIDIDFKFRTEWQLYYRDAANQYRTAIDGNLRFNPRKI